MDFDAQWFFFCVAMLLTAVFSYAARTALLLEMRKTDKAKIDPHKSLLPAELAYLMRPGDSSHCLIVMVVDLVQKGLKRNFESVEHEVLVARYEKLIWDRVSAYIKDWSTQKAHELVPELKTKNPIIIVRGFWKLRAWFTKTLSATIGDLIKDPLSIRKYFSPAGITKVFVSIVTAGLREQVAGELRVSLLEKGLLVDAQRRSNFANLFVLGGFIHLIVASLIFTHYSEVRHWEAIAAFAFFAFFNGIFLRFMAFLPIFVPFYEEFSNVLDSVKRQGVRVAIMQGLLRLLRSVYFSAVCAIVAVIMVMQALVFGLVFHFHASNWWLNLFGIVCLSVNVILIADMFFLAHQVRNNDQATSYGQKQVQKHHKELKDLSLIQAFQKTLAEPGYNEQLSDIVAIYGIETLFLIA
jgi:hypothetical protein